MSNCTSVYSLYATLDHCYSGEKQICHSCEPNSTSSVVTVNNHLILSCTSFHFRSASIYEEWHYIKHINRFMEEVFTTQHSDNGVRGEALWGVCQTLWPRETWRALAIRCGWRDNGACCETTSTNLWLTHHTSNWNGEDSDDSPVQWEHLWKHNNQSSMHSTTTSVHSYRNTNSMDFNCESRWSKNQPIIYNHLQKVPQCLLQYVTSRFLTVKYSQLETQTLFTILVLIVYAQEGWLL